MKWTLADAHGLDDVLIALSKGREVYAPERAQNGSFKLSKAENWLTGSHTLGTYRPTEPLKSLFFPAREFIGRWGNEKKEKKGAGYNLDSINCIRPHFTERIVFGVKNCDLSSLAVFDYVFLQGVAKDPYYAEAREKTILVSSDCSDHLDVCFCPAVGEQPWAEKGFDINIAQTKAGVVIEEGSARGAKVLKQAYALLKPAGDDHLARLEEQRKRHYEALAEHSTAHGVKPGADLQAAVEGSFGSELWSDFAEDCVECGACNFICCTCHCFLLADGVDTDGVAARSKLWDACLYSGFARTAGGGTPRPWRAERLRNRFDKKFSFFPQVLGRYACDGCGRCTEACIANIDIRDVLARAVEENL
jgi:formate hydrogenlyase subunit 6/NADH:ubiquinone oxidoreductase subunit I